MSAIGSGGRVQPARPGDPVRIGPYRIVGRLGAGGMGTVHAGVAPDGLRVAVKVIHPEQAQDPEFRARFRREVELSSRVTGPHVVPLLAADPDAPTPWLATAYVPGPTLTEHVHAHGPLTDGGPYAFAAATAQALAAIHAAGVVHRDVKPQNVLLTPAGPRLLDFGIAHAADGTSLTRTGVMTGTPGWISPEQYRQGSAGPAGDMFAWAALVAYAATGRLPFGAGAPDVVAFRVMSGEADLDGVPVLLRRVVEKALVQEPGDRPAAVEAAEECAALLASQVTQAAGAGAAPAPGDMITAAWEIPPADDPTWQVPSDPRRSRKRVLATVALAAGVVGGLAGGVAALLPGDSGGDRRSSAASASPPTTAGAGRATGNTAQGNGKARQQDEGTGSANAASWDRARAAQGAAEHDVARAVLHDQGVEAEQLGDGVDFAPGAVRFDASRREVYLSYRLSSDEQGTLLAETEIAGSLCLTLRDVVLGQHPDLPYRTYVMVEEEQGREPRVTWQDGFGNGTACPAAGGDETGGAGDGAQAWQPSQEGLGQAMIPSSDDAEIRVADATAKEIIAGTNRRRGTLGTDRVLGHDHIKVGFDPGSSAMYVWSEYLQWNQSQVEAWAAPAAGVACRALVGERERAGSAWPYSRYAVAEIGASGYLMVRWGTATTRGDCPS
ncbi:serine/threonine-protein kinase [Streptomyces sp. NPDC017943]|uniref:serine/threonine-protein kinase n=1 Tax=Streptomyces sp. NPDC017943 TaxID=3365019 RepID=UPI00378DA7E7